MYKVIYQYNLQGAYTSPWSSEIKSILDNTGHSFIWLSQMHPENITIAHGNFFKWLRQPFFFNGFIPKGNQIISNT